MALDYFHPSVQAWFNNHFQAPTTAQTQAWPSIVQGRHTLIAAPTGSGKTLAAFLASIDQLIQLGANGQLPNHTCIVYVSPLKALSNDIQRNLEIPLSGIRDELLQQGLADIPITSMARTGDTPQRERALMRRNPPHILVTTPESLYLLLTAKSGRAMLATASTLIVDEIHALAANKRGAHLSLSIERLDALSPQPLTRIGLSATQKPIDEIAKLLIGCKHTDCHIIDAGHTRQRELSIEVTGSPLEAVLAGEAWEEIYNRLRDLIEAHTTTLIFVNTRRLAERLAKHLAERIGEAAVTSHHGSLAKEHRLDAERRLKDGKLRALVATASLELGIDIGSVDLVCQIGSPKAISAFLQRVGRSGHAVDATPRGRLFPLTRDDLAECTALIMAVENGDLDRLQIPEHPLDVLSQQIVAELASQDWQQTELFNMLTNAWPYRALSVAQYEALLTMLAEGYTTSRGRRGAYLYWDRINQQLRARKGARLTAITNGGAIPDQFDYDVMLEPEGIIIGSLNEDFAFESLPGDIFQLGNISYRMLKIERGKVFVEDARGQPPNIPFWFGEAPGRSDELSEAVADLRNNIEQQLVQVGRDLTAEWLVKQHHLSGQAAVQLTEYLYSALLVLGALPTHDTIVLERFFDEAGDHHLVIHSPFGSRINRAWGLALRKRFCRKFNFELQAAALEDSIVLSLGATHSFPLAEVSSYLHSKTVRDLLIQALLDAPMFATRWRWSASIALAVKRNRNGKRIPAQFQRSDAEALLALVFPDQLACLENIVGAREVPEHPLVQQTIHDCLNELMDISGLEQLLRRIELGQIKIITRDLPSPSPLAQEILTARPFAFLDDAPAEERRTQLVQSKRFLHPEDALALGRLDAQAIARVKSEAWPNVAHADELHDALIWLGFVTDIEGKRFSADWPSLLQQLTASKRATILHLTEQHQIWVSAERLHQFLLLFPRASLDPSIAPLHQTSPQSDTSEESSTPEHALREILRSRLEGVGPITLTELAAPLGITATQTEAALLALQTEGFVIQGQFTHTQEEQEWCERGLLARIHRYTVHHLRSEIEPVSRATFMRFLLHWHDIAGELQKAAHQQQEGRDSLRKVLTQLEGFALPAAAWESEILPIRLREYQPEWLDQLCTSGRACWGRATMQATTTTQRGAGPIRSTPIVILSRRGIQHWRHTPHPDLLQYSSTARTVIDILQQRGACFFDELLEATQLLKAQLEAALGELCAIGLVSSDSFAGLRTLVSPSHKKKPRRRHRASAHYGFAEAGRWSLLQPLPQTPPIDAPQPAPLSNDSVQAIANVLLRRYGIVFRKLLEREAGLPSWRELLYVLRRMEARGEIRGGRFVAGFSGEQFALPEALGLVRQIRKRPAAQQHCVINAADPLNLLGIVLPGARIPAIMSNRILLRDGLPIALLLGKQFRALEKMDEAQQWQAQTKLVRGCQVAPLTELSTIERGSTSF